jgi:hypothetical protein
MAREFSRKLKLSVPERIISQAESRSFARSKLNLPHHAGLARRAFQRVAVPFRGGARCA